MFQSYGTRSKVAHKPDALAKDGPSLALMACGSVLPALSIKPLFFRGGMVGFLFSIPRFLFNCQADGKIVNSYVRGKPKLYCQTFPTGRSAAIG